MSRARPTIDDVAALSGVGRSTVSRVLNGSEKVSDDVRTKVMLAVKELNYKVNMQARFLAGGRGQSITWFYPMDVDIGKNSFFNSMIEVGALRAASQAGFQLLISPLYEHSIKRNAAIIEAIDSQQCDGLILTPPFSDDPELINLIKSRHCPLALIAPGPTTIDMAPGVGIDDQAAGYDLTRHMISLGHKKFHFVKGRQGHISAALRYQGYCEALTDAGLDPNAMRSWQGQFNFASGTEIAEQIFQSGDLPTAIVCANDNMAAGVLFSLHQHELHCPRDISVVGFDDAPICEVIWPPLTTVMQPVTLMGQKVVELLIRDIKEANPESSLPKHETLPHRLILRTSASAPREKI